MTVPTPKAIAALVLTLAIPACQRAAPTAEPSRPEAQSAETVPAQEVRGKLPPPGAAPRFVGRWASDVDACDGSAWRFTEQAVSRPAGRSCRIAGIGKVPGGYELTLHCAASGPSRLDSMHVRFAESAQAMLLESATLGDSGLVYCGANR